jgi:competence protein ComGC
VFDRRCSLTDMSDISIIILIIIILLLIIIPCRLSGTRSAAKEPLLVSRY